MISIILVLLLVYVFVFIRPLKKRGDDELLCEYAHRGLHGANVPENSLSAFEKAVEKGFGIELDVQLSKDGEVVVFHDYSLLRMTGEDKKVCDLSLCELSSLRLLSTEEKIPTLKQVLSVVKGKVPLLVELKGENLDVSLCEKTAEILKTYNGKYCIESFNPLLIKEIRKFLPNAFCGLLYTNVCREKNKKSVLNILLTSMAFNFLARPSFIAYNKKDRDAFALTLVKKLYKPHCFVWTIKGDEELEEARQKGELSIFEK